MTKEEFEQQYAERSGLTVERLYELGRCAAPCDCGDELCEGWQMAHMRTLSKNEIFSCYQCEYHSLGNNEFTSWPICNHPIEPMGKIITPLGLAPVGCPLRKLK